MDELKEKALAKMLKEMEKNHGPAEDAIHNWLSDQDDDELFKGILDDNKSIKKSLEFCAKKAQKHKSGNCAMVDNKTVFGWVRKYFTSKSSSKADDKVSATVEVKVGNEVDVAKIKKGVGPNDSIFKPAKQIKKEKGVVEGQLDLFGDMI